MLRETFIQVIVALRRANAEAGSQAEFEREKASILEDVGVTDSALLEYVRGHDLKYMASVWDSIEARLRPAEDSIR